MHYLNALPGWIEVRAVSSPPDEFLLTLDPGEREAITLALEIKTNTLLMDEMPGREAAQLFGLRVIGTLRVLYDAAELGLCRLEESYERLQQTNFRASATLYQHFLALHRATRLH